MNSVSIMLKQFNWRVLLIRFLINAVTLLLVVFITPKVTFMDRSLLNLLLLALALGILNGLIKPIIHFLTLPFIFATYGLIVVLVNTVILWLLAWIFPDRIAVDSIVWALVAGALYGIISAFLESLFGLNAPIVSDGPEEDYLRERVEAQSTGVVRTLIENQEAEHQQLANLPEPAVHTGTTEVAAEMAAERDDPEVIIDDVTTSEESES